MELLLPFIRRNFTNAARRLISLVVIAVPFTRTAIFVPPALLMRATAGAPVDNGLSTTTGLPVVELSNAVSDWLQAAVNRAVIANVVICKPRILAIPFEVDRRGATNSYLSFSTDPFSINCLTPIIHNFGQMLNVSLEM